MSETVHRSEYRGHYHWPQKTDTTHSGTTTAEVTVSIMDHRNYANYDQSRSLNVLNPKNRPSRPMDHSRMTRSERRRSPAPDPGLGSAGSPSPGTPPSGHGNSATFASTVARQMTRSHRIGLAALRGRTAGRGRAGWVVGQRRGIAAMVLWCSTAIEADVRLDLLNTRAVVCG